MQKIFIGNLPFSATESTLEAFIREFGLEVAEVKVIRDMTTGRSRGFGFVQLADGQNVEDAIALLNGKAMEGRALRVNEAHERSRSGRH